MPAYLKKGDAITVRVPDIPEALTDGSSLEEAEEYAVDAVETRWVNICVTPGNSCALDTTRQECPFDQVARNYASEAGALFRNEVWRRS